MRNTLLVVGAAAALSSGCDDPAENSTSQEAITVSAEAAQPQEAPAQEAPAQPAPHTHSVVEETAAREAVAHLAKCLPGIVNDPKVKAQMNNNISFEPPIKYEKGDCKAKVEVSNSGGEGQSTTVTMDAEAVETKTNTIETPSAWTSSSSDVTTPLTVSASRHNEMVSVHVNHPDQAQNNDKPVVDLACGTHVHFDGDGKTDTYVVPPNAPGATDLNTIAKNLGVPCPIMPEAKTEQ